MMSLAELDGYIEQLRADWQNIGVAVAIIKADEAIYTKGFGAKEAGGVARIDIDTLFQVGSTTKAFAAAALGILVDEGELNWDAPVIDWVPAFRLQDPWLTYHVSIRDAVSHRSGISHSVFPFLGIMDTDEAVHQLRHLAPEGAFRDSCVYSNLMYAVTDKIVEAVSGMSWHAFLKQRLLLPLNMSRSGTSAFQFWDRAHVTPTYLGCAPAARRSIDDARDPNVAMPHGRDESGSPTILPWQSYDNAAPAGSLISSAADMSNWMILNLNEGCFEGRQLLKKETMQELHAAQNLRAGFPTFPFEGTITSYAMGWWRTQYRGHVCLAHSGGMLGFPAYVALLPERKIGVAVLLNSSHPGTTLFHKCIVFRVFDHLLSAPPRDWNREFLIHARQAQRKAEEDESRLRAARRVNTEALRPMDEYAGEYEDLAESSNRVNLRIRDCQLTLSFAGEGAYAAPVEHWHHDLFRLRSNAAAEEVLGPQFVQFTTAPSGEVASMSAFGAIFRKRSSSQR